MQQRTALKVMLAAGAAPTFNDLVVLNHTGPVGDVGVSTKSGRHSIGSWIYWRARDGFTETRRTWIASYGPHATVNAEVGDVLHCRPFETYTSPWTDARLGADDYELVMSGTFRARAGGSVTGRAGLSSRPRRPQKHGSDSAYPSPQRPRGSVTSSNSERAAPVPGRP